MTTILYQQQFEAVCQALEAILIPLTTPLQALYLQNQHDPIEELIPHKSS